MQLMLTATQFDAERDYFDRHREAFVAQADGKYVIVKGSRHWGFYDTGEEAYNAAVEMFGLQPFYIKQILLEDPVHEIPAYFLGLIHASV